MLGTIRQSRQIAVQEKLRAEGQWRELTIVGLRNIDR